MCACHTYNTLYQLEEKKHQQQNYFNTLNTRKRRRSVAVKKKHHKNNIFSPSGRITEMHMKAKEKQEQHYKVNHCLIILFMLC